MNTSLRIALLVGAVAAAAGGIAAAPLTQSKQPAAQERSHAGSRLFSEYDLNHDGKITRAEADRVIVQRFAEDGGAKGYITAQQYGDAAAKRLKDRAAMMFRKADWNGDGKLTQAEYADFSRSLFDRMDRDGSGKVSCASHRRSGTANANRRRGTSFCNEADLNHDGTLTRAEFDKAVAAKFAAAAHGAPALTEGQFFDLTYSRYANAGQRAFARLDANHDGKLSKDEFASGEAKMFARLDANHDGVITKDEAVAHRFATGRTNKPERS